MIGVIRFVVRIGGARPPPSLLSRLGRSLALPNRTTDLIRRVLPLFALVVCGVPGDAADPWHLAGWQARAAEEVAQPAPDADVDTAAAGVVGQGRAKADGAKYPVPDAPGKPVPFH